ncbi:O-antigen polymerase [Vagococcus fluvialis]|uniref:O-antigen polymerase n=1 Tax=Vagococcus fluvialis TaxID=2738 RepID=UPI0037D853FC
MIVVVLIFSICVFLLTLFYSIRLKDFLNPLFLFSTPLFLQYLIYFFVYKKDYRVSVLTLITFVSGLLFFLLGYFLFETLKTKSEINNLNEPNLKTNWIFIYFCLIIGIVFFVLSKIYLGNLNMSNYDLGSAGANLREAFIYSISDIPFYVTYGKYFLLFSVSVIFYEFVNNEGKIKPLFMYSLLLILILNAFLVMSRTDLLITLLPILIIWSRSVKLTRNKKIDKTMFKEKVSMKKKIIIGMGLIVLLFLMNSMRSIGEKGKLFDKNNVLMQYLGRPIVAFDQWILPQVNESKEILILEPINKVFLQLGIIHKDSIKLAPLGQFNVYSYLRVPFMEFGLIGIVIIMLVIGIFANYIYTKSKNGNRNWLIFYAFYSYSFVMAFFDWQFGVMTYAYLIIFLFFASAINTTILKR